MSLTIKILNFSLISSEILHSMDDFIDLDEDPYDFKSQFESEYTTYYN